MDHLTQSRSLPSFVWRDGTFPRLFAPPNVADASGNGTIAVETASSSTEDEQKPERLGPLPFRDDTVG